MFAVPAIRVGKSLSHGSLTVFPLFTEAQRHTDYLLSDEALQQGTVKIQEVSEGGSVPNLLVENSGEVRVLFLEGEELVGAKQNRILNTSILLAAQSTTKIPVSCVERGRWAYRSRHFGSSGTHSFSSLRHALKSSVSDSLARGGGHSSDQGKVWEEVDKQQAAMGVRSPTSAMSDSFAAMQSQIVDFTDKFQYPEGTSGIAAAIGDKIVVVDLFDDPATCRKVWKRLLSGLILEAVGPNTSSGQVTEAEVEETLQSMRSSAWKKVEPVGEGEEYRVELDHGIQASALAFEDSLVHGSLLTGA